jgi:hypothetical protein
LGKEEMTKNKVNITIQIILSVIPLVNLFAWWKIDKFWWGLGVNILSSFVGILGLGIDHKFIEGDENIYTVVWVLTTIMSYIPQVFFMYRWSKQHNKKVQEKSESINKINLDKKDE